ncbi:MAG TPA: hypothetical protein VGH28_18050 [Polyangiaceae bacterium]
MHKPVLASLASLAVLASIGCGRPYNMEVQAVPSPFMRPGCRVVVEPVHSERLLVGAMPEAMYLSQKNPDSAQSYLTDKQESDAEFHKRIIEDHGMLFSPGTPDNTFTIRPTWTHWEPGTVAAFGGSRPATADFLIEVLAPTGQVLDRFDFETAVNASIYNPSSGGRMRSALKKAGSVVSRYISDNWMCAAH